METVYFVECYSRSCFYSMSLKFYNFEKPIIVIPFFNKLHRQTFPVSSTNFHEFVSHYPSMFISALKVAALFEILKLRFE